MTSVPHIAAICQEFVFPKVAVCCVTIDWVTIESTSSYQVQKWIILVKTPAKLAFKEKQKQASNIEEIKRKKLLFKCSRTTVEGRASPAELRLSKMQKHFHSTAITFMLSAFLCWQQRYSWQKGKT